MDISSIWDVPAPPRTRLDSPAVAIAPPGIKLEQEVDGRWLADVVELPGVLVYGTSREEALSKAEALALRTIADRLEHGERAQGFQWHESGLKPHSSQAWG